MWVWKRDSLFFSMYRVCEDCPDITSMVKPRIQSNVLAFPFRDTSFNICTHTFTVSFEKIKCHLNKGWPTRWHLLYYILLNMFQPLIRPSSGASEYFLCCVGWLEACWCYVPGLSVGDVVSECRLNH